MNEEDPALPLRDAVEVLEQHLLQGRPTLNRVEVAEQAGVPLALAEELWRLLGFAHVADDEVAFTAADVEALRLSLDLVRLGVIDEDSQAALVRTWGRSFARLAEWQTSLLARVALAEGTDPGEQVARLADDVLPRIDALQSYVWRRHLTSATARILSTVGGAEGAAGGVRRLSVVFVDIVGYTARSRSLSESELVGWLEHFEARCAEAAVEAGARIIKNIGDEVLLVADDAGAALGLAVRLTGWGEDEDDAFPRVRAGVATGEVVTRLGDVYGPTVNVAARLTSVSRPGRVLVDEGTHDALSSADDQERTPRFKRVRRVSVKGYSRLAAWTVRPERDPDDA